jgi:holo-[acyl-carrier protein] synthase
VVSWLDIEVVNDGLGKPELVLHRAAAELAEELGLSEWSISLTHTQDKALAFVVALGG